MQRIRIDVDKQVFVGDQHRKSYEKISGDSRSTVFPSRYSQMQVVPDHKSLSCGINLSHQQPNLNSPEFLKELMTQHFQSRCFFNLPTKTHMIHGSMWPPFCLPYRRINPVGKFEPDQESQPNH